MNNQYAKRWRKETGKYRCAVIEDSEYVEKDVWLFRSECIPGNVIKVIAGPMPGTAKSEWKNPDPEYDNTNECIDLLAAVVNNALDDIAVYYKRKSKGKMRSEDSANKMSAVNYLRGKVVLQRFIEKLSEEYDIEKQDLVAAGIVSKG